MFQLTISPGSLTPSNHRMPIYLAGGTVSCPDWQASAVHQLSDLDVRILNPRRNKFDLTPGETEDQAWWEYMAGRIAKAILFWFPKESVCPTVLYELGFWLRSGTPLFVGHHPAYPYTTRLILQTTIAAKMEHGRDLVIHRTLMDVVGEFRQWLAKQPPYNSNLGYGAKTP